MIFPADRCCSLGLTADKFIPSLLSRYHEKRTDNLYAEGKRSYAKKRGMVCVPQNKKANKLKDSIKYLEVWLSLCLFLFLFLFISKTNLHYPNYDSTSFVLYSEVTIILVFNSLRDTIAIILDNRGSIVSSVIFINMRMCCVRYSRSNWKIIR